MSNFQLKCGHLGYYEHSRSTSSFYSAPSLMGMGRHHAVTARCGVPGCSWSAPTPRVVVSPSDFWGGGPSPHYPSAVSTWVGRGWGASPLLMGLHWHDLHIPGLRSAWHHPSKRLWGIRMQHSEAGSQGSQLGLCWWSFGLVLSAIPFQVLRCCVFVRLLLQHTIWDTWSKTKTQETQGESFLGF